MDKFEVIVDKKTNTLHVNVEVHNKPEWQGISYYDTTRVINKLKKQGYSVTSKSCIDAGRKARSDSGNREKYDKSKWVFKLLDVVEDIKQEEKKATPPKQSVVQKQKPAKKAPQKTTADVLKNYKTKKTSRKKTKDVVE